MGSFVMENPASQCPCPHERVSRAVQSCRDLEVSPRSSYREAVGNPVVGAQEDTAEVMRRDGRMRRASRYGGELERDPSACWSGGVCVGLGDRVLGWVLVPVGESGATVAP